MLWCVYADSSLEVKREREYLFATAAVGQKGQCPSVLATETDGNDALEIKTKAHSNEHQPSTYFDMKV